MPAHIWKCANYAAVVRISNTLEPSLREGIMRWHANHWPVERIAAHYEVSVATVKRVIATFTSATKY